MKYCTVAKSMGRSRPIERPSSSARASLALCGRFNQFRSPYSWITMRRALRKRRGFDFVPSYLQRVGRRTFRPRIRSRRSGTSKRNSTAVGTSRNFFPEVWAVPPVKPRLLLSKTSTSALNSRQSPRSWPSAMFTPFFGGNCPTEEPPRAGEDISTANALPAVGLWRCSPVFNSKVTNRPNYCAVEQQLREPPTSTVAPPRSCPTKQRSDHSAWSSSSPDFRGIAKRNCGGRFSSADVFHSSSAIEKNDCQSPTFKTYQARHVLPSTI